MRSGDKYFDSKHLTVYGFDPGYSHFGYAMVFTDFKMTKLGPCGTLDLTGTLVDRLTTITNFLYNELILSLKDDGHIFIERQSFRPTPRGLHAAATQHIIYSAMSASLPLAIKVIGKGTDDNKIHYVDPIKWKGQIPDSILNKRIKSRIKFLPKSLSQHAKDAIGIALYGVEHLRSINTLMGK